MCKEKQAHSATVGRYLKKSEKYLNVNANNKLPADMN